MAWDGSGDGLGLVYGWSGTGLWPELPRHPNRRDADEAVPPASRRSGMPMTRRRRWMPREDDDDPVLAAYG